MIILFPMAGLSSRFLNSGISIPKYMLYLGNKSIFELSVCGFTNFFNKALFVFIIRDIFETKKFIELECKKIGLSNYIITILPQKTKGQAETVYKGLNQINKNMHEQSLTIFNIDSFHTNFSYPINIYEIDGYLEVFKGFGENWSYAKTENETSTIVIEVAEKKQISDNCSTGLYYFRSCNLFLRGYETMYINPNNIDPVKEYYVAPIYNNLIEKNKLITINVINKSEIKFCGVPSEFYYLLSQFSYNKDYLE